MRTLILILLLLHLFSFKAQSIYCIPSPTNGVNGYDLSHVKINSLDSTFGGTTSYRFFKDSIHRFTCFLRAGFTYKLYLTSGSTNAVSTSAAWIDWNNDSTFNNITEKLGEKISSGTNQLDSIIFTVPLNCFKGKLRLRIRSSNATSINACTDYASGQTTDFTISTLDPYYDYYFFNNWEYAGTDSNYIDGVQVGTINNQLTGGFDGSVYSYFSNLLANVTACNVVNLNVTTKTKTTGNFIYAYFDINEDGNFDQGSEKVGAISLTPGYQTSLLQFTIPAISGLNRLRVVLFNNVGGIREVEDYSVNVLSSSGNSIPDASIGADFFPDCNSGCIYTGCVGSTTLHDNSCGNPTAWQWSIPGASPATSTVRNPTITLTAGNYIVTLIVSNSFGSDTSSIQISIQSPILNFSLGNDTSICNGGTMQLSAPVSGVNCYSYAWSTGESGSGIRVSASGNYGVYVSNCNNVGCKAYDVINVNYSPVVYNVTGGGSYCIGNPGRTLNLDDSETGVTYQLYINGNPAGTPVSGTGNFISFGQQTTIGAYTVVATNASLACSATMTGSVNVNSVATPLAYNVIGGGSFCQGTGGLAVGLVSSQLNVSYQLYRNGILTGSSIAGNGSTLYFPNQTSSGSYTVVASPATGGCSVNMTDTADLIVNPSPTSYNASGGGYFCGSAGAFVNLSGSQNGITYELINTGVHTGITLSGTGSAISFSTITASGTYTIIATSDSSCNQSMSGAATITIKPNPDVYVVHGGGNFCVGSVGELIYLDSSQVGINYRLYMGGFPLGGVVSGIGGQLNIGNPVTIGTYNVVATNTANACSVTMSGTVFENEVNYPNVFNLTGGGHFCLGDSGVAVGMMNSDSSVSYLLYVDNNPIGNSAFGSNSSFGFGLQTIGGQYSVVGTTINSSCTVQMANTVIVVADICNGVSDYLDKKYLSVYPNPANDFIEIKIESSDILKGYIELTDRTGRILRIWNLPEGKTNLYSISGLSSIATGVYFIKLFINDSAVTKMVLIYH